MIQRVKAISICEPWATLIRLGHKKLETRSWKTSYRGPLLICAAKTIVPWEHIFQLFEGNDFLTAMRKVGIDSLKYIEKVGWRTAVLKRMYPGKAIAICNIAGIFKTEHIIRMVQMADRLDHTCEYNYGNYSPGRFAWSLDDIKPIVPVPVTGKLGLFNVTADIQIEGEPI